MPPKKPTVRFTLVSTKPDGTLTLSTVGTKAAQGAMLQSWSIDWSDGEPERGLGTPPIHPSHQYAQSGDYSVTITVLDNKSMSAAKSLSASIWVNPPTPIPPQFDVLTSADFTLLGGFLVPTSDEYTYGSGLTLRYRDGTPRLLTATYGNPGVGGTPGRIREFSIVADGSLASSTNPGDYTAGTETRNWGDCVQTKIYDSVSSLEGLDACGNANTNFVPIQGLYWDAVDLILYQTFVNFYESVSDATPSNNSLIASTLNDAAGTGTGIGAWKISPRGGSTTPFTTFGNRWTNGATRIPDWFADAYTGGRKLGVGFGHFAWSIVTSGPLSMGPALVAINPPDLAFDTNRDYITRGIVPIVIHPFHADTVSSPYRALRPSTNIINSIGSIHTPDPWDSLTQTYFTSLDHTGGAAWITGPVKHGFVAFESLVGGKASGVIQASPSPTATTFTVDDPGDIGIGDTILGTTDGSFANSLYPYAVARVSGISGSNITVEGTKTDAQTFAADATAFRAAGECFCGTKYVGGGPMASRWTNSIRIYNPSDLASAALGSTNYGSVPCVVEEIEFVGRSYPIRKTLSEPSPMQVRGVAWDSVTKRLYVRTHAAFSGTTLDLIQVFSVNC